MKKLSFSCLFSLLVLTNPCGHIFSEQAVNKPTDTPLSTVQRIVHNVHNLETEVSFLKQKIENQETNFESLRQEVVALIKATKEQNTKSQDAQSEKLSKLEKNVEKLVLDMKQFKSHANETSEALASTQKSIQEQMEQNKVQGKQMQDMEAATKALVKTMQNKLEKAKESVSTLIDSSSDKDGRYRVKSGDSLAKIAKEFNTSAQRLRELNDLKSDKITVGQLLVVSDSH